MKRCTVCKAMKDEAAFAKKGSITNKALSGVR